MYRGMRDVPLQIPVRQSFCEELHIENSGMWIAVYVPPRSLIRVHHPWPSFVVRPEQVYVMDDIFNIVCVNRGANLSLFFHMVNQETGDKIPVGKEFDRTEKILARFLQYEIYLKHGIPSNCNSFVDWVDEEFAKSGLTVQEYVKRIINGQGEC